MTVADRVEMAMAMLNSGLGGVVTDVCTAAEANGLCGIGYGLGPGFVVYNKGGIATVELGMSAVAVTAAVMPAGTLSPAELVVSALAVAVRA